MPLYLSKIYIPLVILNAAFWYGNFHYGWGHHVGLFQDYRSQHRGPSGGFGDFVILGLLPLFGILVWWFSQRPSISILQLEPYTKALNSKGWNVDHSAVSSAIEMTRGDRQGTLRLQFGTRVSQGPKRLHLELNCPEQGFPPGLRIVTEASRLPSLMNIALQSRRTAAHRRFRESRITDTRIGHHRLDDLLAFSCDDPSVLLERVKNEQSFSLLGGLMKDCEDFQLTPGRVVYDWKSSKTSVSHGDVLARIESIDEILWRLSGRFDHRMAYQNPWQMLAEAMGLEDSLVELEDEHSILGRSDERRVSIAEYSSEDGIGIRIQISFLQSMPSGFRVMKSSPDLVSKIRLQNPILDQAVVAYGRPEQRVRVLLDYAPVMEPLMVLLNECEAAVVREKRVEILFSGSVSQRSEIRRYIDMALSLVRALDGAAAAN